MASSGKFDIVNHGALGDGIRCPNCSTRLRQGVSTPCRNCGTKFRRQTARRINTKYQYWKPWISTMTEDKIREFCENADTVHRTENYSFVYAKKGDATRIHVSFFGALKRCVQIILRPLTTT